MNRNPRQPMLSIQPLPDDFSPALREIDDRLSRHAAQMTAPIGLADRVFAASSEILNQSRRSVEAHPRLRFVPAEPRPLHQLRWARLAMAASVAFICGVGLWIMQPPRPAANQPIAMGHAATDLLSDSLESNHPSAASHYEANLGYLLETHELTREELERDVMTLARMF